MKIAVGMHLQDGPWGGGNQFGQSLVQLLQKEGVDVHFDLIDRDLDIILLTEPRRNLAICAFDDQSIFRYLLTRNHRAIVIHRINECDERKGTQGVNDRLLTANICADHTVFVATWLQKHFQKLGLSSPTSSVILNGSNKKLFHSCGYQRWNKKEKLRLVTHHWGANRRKGFDIYEQLDSLLATKRWKDRLSFSYIGNVPKDFCFKNAKHYPPCHGEELSDLLRSHHVYLTASQFEPGGHHQNEGASCGLPLIYRRSGCMPEYCEGFGISFDTDDFEDALEKMLTNYDSWEEKMKNFPLEAKRTVKNYFDLFKKLLSEDEAVRNRRSLLRFPRWIWSRFLWKLQHSRRKGS